METLAVDSNLGFFVSVSLEFRVVLIFFFLLLLQIRELLSSYLELVVSLVLFGCLFLV